MTPHREYICPKCKGDGWYADHAPNCQDENGNCTGHMCPMQIECDLCQATGKVSAEQALDYNKKNTSDSLPF